MPRLSVANLAGLATGVARGLVNRNRYFCVCCESRVFTFYPYKGGSRFAPAIDRQADIIGSDVDNFSCSGCGASDRERHLFLYLDATGLDKEITGASVLHFAPEPQVSKRIVSRTPGLYVRADLFPASPDIEKVDMLDIPYPDGKFDMVIANHVLEHVPDDGAALAELYRVLRPGGHAILQTPYAAARRVTEGEAESPLDPRQRRERFGQEDHVRLFGLDFFQRVEAAGFESAVSSHEALLADKDPAVYGVNPREPFMHFRRPG